MNKASVQVLEEYRCALRRLRATAVLRQMEESLTTPGSPDEQTRHLTNQPASPLPSFPPPSFILFTCQLLPLIFFVSLHLCAIPAFVVWPTW